MRMLRFFFAMVGNVILTGFRVIADAIRPLVGTRLPRLIPRLPRLNLTGRARMIAQVSCSSAVIVASSVWICVMLLATPKVDIKARVILGRGTAEETAKLLDNKGEIVVVAWASDLHRYTMVGQEAELQEFKKALDEKGQVKLAGTERVSVDEIDRSTMRLTGVFSRVLQKYPRVDAVVSFIGVPDLERSEMRELSRTLPKFVVVTDLLTGLDKFFQDKLITVAIVPRLNRVEMSVREPETPRELFDYSYQVVTAGTVSSLSKDPTRTRAR